MNNLPILYSFRRCPYAMRARIFISMCDIEVELREVHLKNMFSNVFCTSPRDHKNHYEIQWNFAVFMLSSEKIARKPYVFIEILRGGRRSAKTICFHIVFHLSSMSHGDVYEGGFAIANSLANFQIAIANSLADFQIAIANSLAKFKSL